MRVPPQRFINLVLGEAERQLRQANTGNRVLSQADRARLNPSLQAAIETLHAEGFDRVDERDVLERVRKDLNQNLRESLRSDSLQTDEAQAGLEWISGSPLAVRIMSALASRDAPAVGPERRQLFLGSADGVGAAASGASAATHHAAIDNQPGGIPAGTGPERRHLHDPRGPAMVTPTPDPDPQLRVRYSWLRRTTAGSDQTPVAAAVTASNGTAELDLLRAAKGFAKLSQRDTHRLELLITGAHGLAAGARDAVRDLLAEPDWAGRSAAKQARAVKALISNTDRLPELAAERFPAPVAATPPSFTVEGPVAIPYHQFADTKIPALRYEVKVEGQTIPIIVPHPAFRGADLEFPGVDQIAGSLAAIPGAMRGLVTHVQINPFQNAADEFWDLTVDNPVDYGTLMWVGDDGIVGVFPGPEPWDSKYFRDILLHEVGHVWSLRDWGLEPEKDAAWDPWVAAMKEDVAFVSSYAASEPAEDLAESAVAYVNTMGSAEHDALRALFPQRFAILDGVFRAMGMDLDGD